MIGMVFLGVRPSSCGLRKDWSLSSVRDEPGFSAGLLVVLSCLSDFFKLSPSFLPFKSLPSFVVVFVRARSHRVSQYGSVVCRDVGVADGEDP